MQIHLYLSDSAPARKKLKDKLQNILQASTVIEHQSIDTLKRTILGGHNEQVVSVIMVENNIELLQLAKINLFWGNSKNIIIIPDYKPETTKLANALRPVFMTNMNSSFAEIVLILEHIKNRYDSVIQKDQLEVNGNGNKGTNHVASALCQPLAEGVATQAVSIEETSASIKNKMH